MDEDIIYIFRNILEDSTVHRKHKNSILLLLEGYERQGWDIFEQYELDRNS